MSAHQGIIGLHAISGHQMSALGRGCVNTSLKPEFVPNLRDFRKLQFAKALISLKLKFVDWAKIMI